MSRSEQERILRDKDALVYDQWYLERGRNAVRAEDETILRCLGIDNNTKTFLDFGCGTGRFTEIIRRKYPHIQIYGLDISPKSIEVIKSKNIIQNAQVFDASKEKIKEIGYPLFDRILSMQMIQHLDKNGAINAVNNIYDSLNENDIAVIELYNFTGLNRILERIKPFSKIKKIEKKDLFFEYRYGADEFKDFCLKYSKFKQIDIVGCQNISRRWINKFSFLIPFDLWLSKFNFSKYLGYYFIAILKK